MCTAFIQLVQIIITLSTNDNDDDQGRISHIGLLSYSLGRQEQRGGSAVNFLSLTIVAIEWSHQISGILYVVHLTATVTFENSQLCNNAMTMNILIILYNWTLPIPNYLAYYINKSLCIYQIMLLLPYVLTDYLIHITYIINKVGRVKWAWKGSGKISLA